MNIEHIKENYIFETLNQHHDLNDFECESQDLTDFLKDDTLNQQIYEFKLNTISNMR